MERTMFDIAAQKSVGQREDEGTAVHVKSADGEPQFYGDNGARQPVTIRVVGTYSATYRRAVQAMRDRIQKQRRTALTEEQKEEKALELIAACILGWDGITNGEQPFPFTRENAIALLEAAPWVREDVEAAMADHQVFFSNSSAR